MILLIQRCLGADVSVEGETVSEIGQGLAVFVGVTQTDGDDDALRAAEKLVNMRIFENEACKLDRSVRDIDGEVLIVSNFTLCGDASHGRRPEFISAARREEADRLYCLFAEEVGKCVRKVGKGVFGADMRVNVVNDGPVNIIYDTQAAKK